MYFPQPILTPQQLRRLEKHKYSSNSESVLDPTMQIWWNYVVGWMPLWLAPNLITMLGLVLNVSTSIVLMWLCPTATEPAPRWPTLACALGLFLYQTLDAIDGKQARRTGSQSPLGELFDHGCDSLSTVFVTMASACTVSLGHLPSVLLLQCFTASVLFYCAHWQAYVTGTMRFGKIDVTEAQVCVMLTMLVTVVFGPGFWDLELLGLDMRATPTVVGCVLSGWSLLMTLQIISNGGAGKNGSTIAGTSVITPVIPIALVVVPGTIIACNSSEHVFEENPILFVVTWGVMAAKVTNKLIVAHMTKSEMSNNDVTLVVPTAFFVRSYCHLGAIISEKGLLVLAAAFVSVDIILYCRGVCMEICDHLKVDLFRIPAPSEASTSKRK